MAQEELDELLSRMPVIAAAVNAFTSEAVQHEAFSALIVAFEGRRDSGTSGPATVATDAHETRSGEIRGTATPLTAKAPKTEKSKKQRKLWKGSDGEWRVVKDLDIYGNGRKSFEDFIAEKRPSSNEDRYVVVVYYLSEILGVSAVSIHQVGTVFRLTKAWKEPTNVAGGLSVAASRKGTLDTKDYEDIKITPAGRNFVEHDLPPKPKSS
jgi:hypothetical protein